MSTVNTNSQRRPSLSEQIDRLDGILDGLADGLNDAVAGAVREAVSGAVRQAVEAVLLEVQTNTGLRARLCSQAITATAEVPPAHSTPAPSGHPVASERPSWLRRLWTSTCAAVVQVGASVRAAMGTVCHSVIGLLGLAADIVSTASGTVWNQRTTIVVAIGAAATMSILFFYGGPLAVAVWTALSSLAGVCVARAAKAWNAVADSAYFLVA